MDDWKKCKECAWFRAEPNSTFGMCREHGLKVWGESLPCRRFECDKPFEG